MLSSCFEMGHNVTDANAKSLLNKVEAAKSVTPP